MPVIRKLIDLLSRGKAAGVKADASRERQWISNPWHAVSIVPSARSCRLARSVAQVRFLSQQAPQLPMADCTVRPCTCRYRHFEDRRAMSRRDSDLVGSHLAWMGLDRRVARGRRSTDQL